MPTEIRQLLGHRVRFEATAVGKESNVYPSDPLCHQRALRWPQHPHGDVGIAPQ